MVVGCLTKKAEPPPTRDVNRDSGTDSANGGWLRRLVRLRIFHTKRLIEHIIKYERTRHDYGIRWRYFILLERRPISSRAFDIQSTTALGSFGGGFSCVIFSKALFWWDRVRKIKVKVSLSSLFSFGVIICVDVKMFIRFYTRDDSSKTNLPSRCFVFGIVPFYYCLLLGMQNLSRQSTL